MHSPLDSDFHDAVARLLREAGASILLPAFARARSTTAKADGSIVTDTDLACQQWIQEALARLRPDIPLLGEEMTTEHQRAMLAAGGECWCLDPLDGTSNFVAGIPLFGLSLALLRDGRPAAAWIHDPVRGETFHAVAGGGAWLNADTKHPLRAEGPARLRDAVGFLDFKRLNAELAARLAADAPARSFRNLGSCALEWAWLAAGRGAFIVHGGEKIWDFAAGALLAAEAGAMVTDFTGRPLPGARLPAASPILAAASAIHPELQGVVSG